MADTSNPEGQRSYLIYRQLLNNNAVRQELHRFSSTTFPGEPTHLDNLDPTNYEGLIQVLTGLILGQYVSYVSETKKLEKRYSIVPKRELGEAIVNIQNYINNSVSGRGTDGQRENGDPHRRGSSSTRGDF